MVIQVTHISDHVIIIHFLFSTKGINPTITLSLHPNSSLWAITRYVTFFLTLITLDPYGPTLSKMRLPTQLAPMGLNRSYIVSLLPLERLILRIKLITWSSLVFLSKPVLISFLLNHF